MKRLIVAIFLAIAVPVLAAAVHFVKGPLFVDIGTQLIASGKLAGLGEGDITIILNANGLATTECNNNGGNVAPGQNTVVSTSGSITLPVPKNGMVTFTVATATPSIASSACPNPLWTAEATDVTFAGITITVLQNGQIVLQETF